MASYIQTDDGLDLTSDEMVIIGGRSTYLGSTVVMAQPEGKRGDGTVVVYFTTQEGDPPAPVDNDATITVTGGRARVDASLEAPLKQLGWKRAS